ncbi:MAG: hypothetical protein JNM18_12145 [Planctomycetaceae bacterium]|nr:hypothetical protein [Planctomycetaceae bacterium]
MTRQARRIRQRRGTTLVLFAVLLFALLPMMALVLDLGIVRVTQRQMQTAANVAAIEGLRHRDSKTDVERREAARDTVKQLFDDNLDPNTPSTGFSAGPQALVVPNTGTPLIGNSYRWSPQLMTDGNQLPIVTQFRPTLQLNRDDNKQYGDLVAGTYDTTAASDPNTLFTEQTIVSGMTFDYYKRNDFTAVDVADVSTSRSFLARLRRTRLYENDQEPDDESGVSSAGPPVPFVFGRGGLASGGTPDPNALWNQREAGVTVRATAIADARPALTVGPAIPRQLYTGLPTTIDGLAPFALSVDYWTALSSAADQVITKEGLLETDQGLVFGVTSLVNNVDANSTVLTVRAVLGWGVASQTPFLVRVQNELMRVTAINATMSADEKQWTVERGINSTAKTNHAADTRIIRHEVMTIGTAILPSQPSTSSAAFDVDAIGEFPTLETFVPIYATVGTLGKRVIGFGRATISRGTDSLNPDEFLVSIAAKPSIVAPQNASAQLLRPLPSDVTNSPEVNDLFARRNAGTLPDRWLLAPALVRTLGKLAN